jgi:hypothetical protein
LAAFVQPVKFPQLNIPIETLREEVFFIDIFTLVTSNFELTIYM